MVSSSRDGSREPEAEEPIPDLQVTDQDAAEQVKGGAEQVKEAISLNYERIQVKYTER